MFLMMILAGLVQVAAAPQTAEAAGLTLIPPSAEERLRCQAPGLSRPSLTVTMQCRVTSFGRPTDCTSEPIVSTSDRRIFKCLAEAHRFRAASGSPARPNVEIPLTAVSAFRP